MDINNNNNGNIIANKIKEELKQRILAKQQCNEVVLI